MAFRQLNNIPLGRAMQIARLASKGARQGSLTLTVWLRGTNSICLT